MKKTDIITFSFFAALFPVSVKAMELDLRPGLLPERMAAVMASADDTLVLKGTATSCDLTALRLLPPDVKALDLSALKICGGSMIGEEWFGRSDFEEGEIPAYMLLGTNVESIVLPPSVSLIGAGAFSATPLKEFYAAGVKRIGEALFHDCRQLRKVDFQDAEFSEIPSRAFSGCLALEELHVPHRVVSVGPHAFEKCNISAISLPYVVEMGDYAFAYASSLEEIRFNKGCRMGEGVFFGAGALASLPADPGNIPALFSTHGNSMEVINIKSPQVGEGAYSNSAASTVWMSGDVKEIEAYAFHSMPNLKKVVVEECQDIPYAHPDAFAGNDVARIILHVGPGNAERWRQEPVWRDFNISEEESGVSESLMPGVDGGAVRIAKHDGRIAVSAALPIREVAVFALDGSTVSIVSPNADSYEIPFPDGYEVVLVKASDGREVNVVKLSR